MSDEIEEEQRQGPTGHLQEDDGDSSSRRAMYEEEEGRSFSFVALVCVYARDTYAR